MTEEKREPEYICAVHNSAACNDCVNDLFLAEQKIAELKQQNTFLTKKDIELDKLAVVWKDQIKFLQERAERYEKALQKMTKETFQCIDQEGRDCWKIAKEALSQEGEK